MKIKPILPAVILFGASLILVSWGVTGHRTVGLIAENHLTPQARAAVQSLLDSGTLADASTWADEVRNQAKYRHTSSWHFLNLPLGLTYTQFQQQVEGTANENVYSALLKEEKDLASSATSRETKIEALKFIVHFVGDLHQPMHVSRAEDKGGNTIQLNYDGRGTNLHSLWDSKLLEHQGLKETQLAAQYDHATPAQIKQWQSDPLMQWIWESYQASSKLYTEVDAMKSRSIGDEYYQAHIAIIQDRIEKAGIRLAGVLNDIFKTASIPAVPATPKFQGPQTAKTIDVKDAANHFNENVRVCAKVYGSKAFSGMTLLNLGASYPNQLLTGVLKGAALTAYPNLDGQTICVTGKIVEYKGKPEIVVTDKGQISTEK